MEEKPAYEELEQRIALLESELKNYKEGIPEKFKKLADRSQDVIYHYDVKARAYSFANIAALDLYGIGDGDDKKITTQAVLLHIHPKDRERVKKAAAESLVSGSIGAESEYRFMHPDGSLRWMHDRWVIIRDSSGEAVAIEGIVRVARSRGISVKGPKVVQIC